MIGEITMNIIGKQCEQGYNFYEEGHKIYTMTNQSEKGLIRLTLLNQLGYPVYEVFQLVSWKDRFRKNKYDFAIYEGEEKIAEFTNLDYTREVPVTAQDYEYPEMIRAVARYKRINGSSTAEFGLVVEDAWQRRGLAKLLMNALHENSLQI